MLHMECVFFFFFCCSTVCGDVSCLVYGATEMFSIQLRSSEASSGPFRLLLSPSYALTIPCVDTDE